MCMYESIIFFESNCIGLVLFDFISKSQSKQTKLHAFSLADPMTFSVKAAQTAPWTPLLILHKPLKVFIGSDKSGPNRNPNHGVRVGLFLVHDKNRTKPMKPGVNQFRQQIFKTLLVILSTQVNHINSYNLYNHYHENQYKIFNIKKKKNETSFVTFTTYMENEKIKKFILLWDFQISLFYPAPTYLLVQQRT